MSENKTAMDYDGKEREAPENKQQPAIQNKPPKKKMSRWKKGALAACFCAAGYFGYQHFWGDKAETTQIFEPENFAAELYSRSIHSAKVMELASGQYLVNGYLKGPKTNMFSDGKGDMYQVVFTEDPSDTLTLHGVEVENVPYSPQAVLANENILTSDFKKLARKRQITSLNFTHDSYGAHIQGTYKVDGPSGYSQSYFTSYASVQDVNEVLDKAGDRIRYNSTPIPGPSFWDKWGPTLMIAGVFIGLAAFAMRSKKGLVGGAKHRIVKPNEVEQSFDDIKGVDGAKEELKEMVDFLTDSERLTKMGGYAPSGALVVGPPGTGKTMLAKAVAKEANATFIEVSGADFDEKLVGVGSDRVRQLFADARRHAPCIIFIDEIDALVKSRDSNPLGSSSKDDTITKFLTEMDGFNSNEKIVVMAATNRPESLDKAAKRPGRFDRMITVDIPSQSGRLEVLKLYSKHPKTGETIIGDDVDLETWANMTSGFSPAQLKSLINEAVIFAFRSKNRNKACREDIQNAFDKIILGSDKSALILTPEEHENTCVHEAGHIIVSKYTPAARKILKATVKPRGNALGHVMYETQGDQVSYTKEQLLAEIDSLLGGRIAEKLYGGGESSVEDRQRQSEKHVTTGASNDIERATSIARNMVLRWGYSELGMQNFVEKEQDTFLGKSGMRLMDMSEEQKQTLDKAIHKIISDAQKRVEALLKAHADEHQHVKSALDEYETITGEEIDAVCGGEKIARTPFEDPEVNHSDSDVSNNEQGSVNQMSVVDFKIC